MGHSLGSVSNRNTSYSSQRKVPRYTFVAVTEITDSTSQACILAKTIKISCQGCYVETLSPLPVGTSLNMGISRDQGSFTTKGRVIYVREGSGMGLVFLDTTGDQLQVLDYWLAAHPRDTDAL